MVQFRQTGHTGAKDFLHFLCLRKQKVIFTSKLSFLPCQTIRNVSNDEKINYILKCIISLTCH